MKVLMRILGVLLLLGGLGLAGLMMTGNLVQRAESGYEDSLAKLEKAEKQYEIDPTEKQKKEVEGWRKNVDDSGKLLNERKQNRTFGVIGGVTMTILGIGLFGLSFIFGKKVSGLVVITLTLTILTVNSSAQNLGGWASAYISDIKKVKAGLDSSNSNEGFKLSRSTNDDWIKYSVSKTARDKFFSSTKFNDFEKAEINKALDSLAESAARELERYKPYPNNFTFKSPAHEKLIKNRLANLATLKIHKIGFATANWLIHTNNYGLPRLRFKRGYIYARDKQDDHNFCHIYYISVNQDYSGGGTFGAAYPSFVSDELAVCPK